MAEVSIFYGSVYGNAQQVAEDVASHLSDKGIAAKVVEEPDVDALKNAEAVLVVTSTTGQGDVPPNLEWWVDDLKSTFPLLNQKPFAVAALGDSSYGDTYCGGGKQVFALLEELQGQPIAPMLEVDAIETLEPEAEVIAWVDSILDKLAS
ncbi:flavodoxin [Alteromonas sediminis]|uniref:Flavodoxin n=1 Tax=Alteromonas sediminis TaxID=2259342 RepID=A0A3N5Y4C0_9ALTE|nr:flavodoxin domain-containing protein [Alteromonas sediminis]RPJ68360.1 flavodoxin [Alteromonas sediminis]